MMLTFVAGSNSLAFYFYFLHSLEKKVLFVFNVMLPRFFSGYWRRDSEEGPTNCGSRTESRGVAWGDRKEDDTEHAEDQWSSLGAR